MRLLNKRYEEIKKIVVELFTELNLYDVPIDCFKICEMLGIVVIKYSDVKEEKRKACKEFSKDGFCMEIEKNDQSVFYIYYDDSMYDRRIRFTIMHEIGHIDLQLCTKSGISFLITQNTAILQKAKQISLQSMHLLLLRLFTSTSLKTIANWQRYFNLVRNVRLTL